MIISTIKETDTYFLSIHDAIYRGREDFNYRVELGEIPFLEYVYPCVGKIRKNTEVTLKGVNLLQNKTLFKPSQEGYGELRVTGKNGFVSNPVIFYGLPQDAHLNVSPSEKEKFLTDYILVDSITSPNQIKTYRITALKNEKIAIDIKARRLGSMLDAKMTLRDPSGAKLTEVDDVEDATQGLMTHHADPVLQYKVNRAGNYILEVSDVLGNCGSDYYYMIERLPNFPAFQTFVSPANLTIPRGGTALFRVDIFFLFSKKNSPPGWISTSKACPKAIW